MNVEIGAMRQEVEELCEAMIEEVFDGDDRNKWSCKQYKTQSSTSKLLKL